MENPDERMTVQLGRTIRYKRKRLGLTQEQLAEMLGIGHQAMSRIEQGIIAPKMDRLPAIAKSLQCSVADLFRENSGDSAGHAQEIAELLIGLPAEKQRFIVNHIAGLAYFLKQ